MDGQKDTKEEKEALEALDLDIDTKTDDTNDNNPAETTAAINEVTPTDNKSNEAVRETVDTFAPTETVLPQLKGSKRKISKKVAALLAVAMLLVASVGFVAYAKLGKTPDNDITTNTQPSVALMGAELSVVDGVVMASSDENSWSEVKTADQVTQGTFIKTEDNARAVINLDDGSAIRINSNSVVKIDSLDANNVVITNVTGSVYTRLVPSERAFSVNVADETYTSLGTAYITRNTAEAKGVEVYESKVKIVKANVEVPEGSYYYTEMQNAEQAKKLAELSVDKMKQDAFLAWNYQEDKASDAFKEKLGYMKKIDEQPAPAPAPTPTQPSPSPTTASIKLSGATYEKGVKLSWTVNGVSATKGFKVVKSLSANPTYGKDSAEYVSDPNARSLALVIKDGKTWNFRICAYNGESCTNYSNNIAVKAPINETSVSDPLPTGKLSLASAGGLNVSWTLNGSSPYGYKLVWSKEGSPVYPGNDYQYYSSESTKTGSIEPSEPGTYYVRVCMYNTTGTGDKCMNYSNQIVITK